MKWLLLSTDCGYSFGVVCCLCGWWWPRHAHYAWLRAHHLVMSCFSLHAVRHVCTLVGFSLSTCMYVALVAFGLAWCAWGPFPPIIISNPHGNPSRTLLAGCRRFLHISRNQASARVYMSKQYKTMRICLQPENRDAQKCFQAKTGGSEHNNPYVCDASWLHSHPGGPQDMQGIAVSVVIKSIHSNRQIKPHVATGGQAWTGAHIAPFESMVFVLLIIARKETPGKTDSPRRGERVKLKLAASRMSKSTRRPKDSGDQECPPKRS